MFGERVRGRSAAGIARELNARGAPCPSNADRARNPHRRGDVWIVRTVLGILENPRYTGLQVWDRHGTSEHEQQTVASGCVVSEHRCHAALVDDGVFVTVQGMRASRLAQDGSVRTHVLAGLVVCGVCRRRMDAHWVHARAGYRCRHGYTSAQTRPPDAAKNLYVREEHLLAGLRHRQGEEVGHGDGDLAGDVRSRGLVIVCTGSTWSLEKATREQTRCRVPAELTQLQLDLL